MSEIIDFLEKIGKNSELRYASVERLSSLMIDTDPALIEAVVSGNQQVLEAILGARTNVVCGVYPADEPQPETPEDEPQDDETVNLKKTG